MLHPQIVDLWNSPDCALRIAALCEIEMFPFIANNAIPDWARRILAHAMYHDYRPYGPTYEVWVDSLLKSNALCNKYHWDFSAIILSESEMAFLGVK